MTSRINGPNQLQVCRDISGGVLLRLHNTGCVLSPQQAIDLAAAVLRAAGVDVEFRDKPGIIRPAARVNGIHG